MTDHGSDEGPRFPTRSLAATVVLTVLLLAWFGWQAYSVHHEAGKGTAILDLATTVGGILVLTIGWLILLGIVNNWRTALSETSGKLAAKTAESGELNRSLDRKVEERTRELAQANEALTASEERFRSLVETSSDWVWEVDANGVYTYASPKVRDLLGYEPEEIVGKAPFDLMPPEEQERVAAEFGAIVEAGEPVDRLVNTNVHRDGHPVVLETSGVPVFDDRGQVRGYRGIDRDITERRRLEERMEHLGAVLLAIRNVNQLITHEGDSDKLLRGACEALTATPGYLSAWAALRNENGEIVDVAGHGLGAAIQQMDEWLRGGGSCCCLDRALGQPDVAVVQDPPSLCGECPLAGKYEDCVALSVRLEHAGRIYGVLTVAIPRAFADDVEELSLFEEVAEDIAFALHSIEMEAYRKQVEQAVERLRRRNELILNSAGEGIVEIDRGGDIMFANPAAAKMLGRDVNELVDRSHHTITEPAKQNNWVAPEGECPVCATLEDGSPRGGADQVFWREDGSSFPVAYTCAPVRERDRTVACVVVFNDISGRRQAEVALRESEERFRDLFDGAPVGYHEIDTEGRITRVNQTELNMLGYTREEMEGKHVWEFITEGETSKQAFFAKVAGEAGGGRSFERTYRCRDGRMLPVLIEDQMLRGHRNQIIGIRSTIQDISERKEAREALRKARDELEVRVRERTAELMEANRALQAEIAEHRRAREALELDESRLEALVQLNQMTDASMQVLTEFALEEAVRLTSSKMGYLGFMNDDESVLTMLAWSKDVAAQCNVPGRPVVYHVEQMGLWGEAIRQRKAIITNDYSASGPSKKGLPEGHPNISRHMNVPVFEGDRIVAVAGVANKEEGYDESDVRQMALLIQGMWRLIQRKLAEDELVQHRERLEKLVEARTEELARSNRELEQFAYVASHDLQEPLRMIGSYVQLLERRYKDKLDQDATEFIAFAVDGAQRMQRLINDLLMYSRVGTRRKELTRTSCENVLDLSLANLQTAIGESGAEVTHDALPEVMADETQFLQLFQNLIGNAVKFRGEDPPRIHVSATQADNEWIFAVKDNGIGMDVEQAERIFMIFQRLHTREEYPGTGIGLAVCKRIVERHDGRIWVESEPGNGSAFSFAIPVAGSQ